jgi:hypothetical protein
VIRAEDSFPQSGDIAKLFDETFVSSRSLQRKREVVSGLEGIGVIRAEDARASLEYRLVFSDGVVVLLLPEQRHRQILPA